MGINKLKESLDLEQYSRNLSKGQMGQMIKARYKTHMANNPGISKQVKLIFLGSQSKEAESLKKKKEKAYFKAMGSSENKKK